MDPGEHPARTGNQGLPHSLPRHRASRYRNPRRLALVISLLLGVPYADHEFFRRTARGLDSRSTDEQKATAIGEIFGHVYELVARKEREPGDDLISRLVIDHVATGALSRETATMNAVIMLQAGHETTTSVISLGMLALLQHPEQLARLLDTDDPAVVANVVGELMRYLTIVHSLVERVAVEDLVIAGQQIQAGARFPGLRLAVPESDKKIRNEQEIYGIESLPVTW